MSTVVGATRSIAARLKREIRQRIGPVRYQLMVRFQPRRNRVYTQFARFPHQVRAIAEKLLPELVRRDPSLASRSLEIAVFACCSGEEVFTLSYYLRSLFPELRLRIRGYDIVSEVVERARLGRYTNEEVFAGPFVTEEFVAGAFEVDGDGYRVKDALRDGVSFEVADMTDSNFMAGHDQCDLVFAQNVLFHLPRPVARDAFHNLVRLLRPGGALFISGMDTDMRIALTKSAGLEPLEYLVEEIHEDARVDRGANWSGQYWGREPFSRTSADWLRKYGTVYLAKA